MHLKLLFFSLCLWNPTRAEEITIISSTEFSIPDFQAAPKKMLLPFDGFMNLPNTTTTTASAPEGQGGKMPLQCQGKAITVDEELLTVDEDCSWQTKQAGSFEPENNNKKKYIAASFNCRIACRWAQQGWLEMVEDSIDPEEIYVYVDQVYPEAMRSGVKRGFRRCFRGINVYDPRKDTRSCQGLTPIISCLRRVHFEFCNEYTEDLITHYNAESFTREISYGYCRNKEVKWGKGFLPIHKDCADIEMSYTCLQRCIWDKLHLMTKGGDINVTAHNSFTRKTFPKMVLEDMRAEVYQCQDDYPPGTADYKNECINSEPFFACVHRAFFKVCRPDDYLIPYPSTPEG